MKKLCFLTISLILLSCHTANSAVNGDYANNANKVEKYVLAENPFPLYQNYIIFSKKPVKKITSLDSTIAHAYVMTTIDNVRGTVIVEAHSIGSTKLIATVENKEIVINVTVKKNKTIVECDSDLFEIISLDVPSAVTFTQGA